ncbi:MAG TPA: protein kinase [Pyrinomonadaceae bacterium]|nr:protein kinase [Pyrinomonadaceae bacterium]
MQTEIWQIIDSLFDEYLDASPEAQSNFLGQKNLAPEIHNELKKLISAISKSESFIETPKFTQVKEILNEAEDSLIGRKIGSYKLEKLLGKGGMGSVYLATRIDDFSKEVAIKLIPAFSQTKSTAENFRRERQILARLEHENIAQILDGGTTEDGTPYLVMEYVDGLPLDKYCEKENLSVTQRLNLFLKVCEAVTFAHQNLIVHRDLKPNNILVRKNGKVKLLDFGIAKLLQTDEVDFSTEQTLKGNAFTPEYASPEQINGDVVTTASDVYSLGVVLYELLTNTRPHSFKDKSLNDILRIITTEEIALPSAIQNSKFKIQNSEIEVILLKSLAKNPRERYQTASELHDDIYNSLHNLPISARPNTTIYRAKKFIQRNQIQVGIAFGIFVLTIGWLSTYFWQTLQTASQARENRRTAYAAEMILAANEYGNTNLNRVKELVEKYRPQKGEDDLRGFEWYFLNNLLNPKAKKASLQHPDEVWSTEFSPDGKFLATVSNDDLTRIWNVETKSVVAQTAEQKGAWKCSYFPDGKRFVVASSSNANPFVVIYNTENASEILRLQGHEKRVRAVDVSPDGKTIATGSLDGTVRIWDTETGKELHKLDLNLSKKGWEVHDLQFSKSGEKIVIAGFELIAILDIKTWEIKRIKLDDFADKNIILNPWKVVFSPLEKTIAFGNWTGEVILIDADKLKIIKVLPLHQVNVKSLAFSNDGRTLATSSWDRTVKFVDVQTGEIINELKGHFAGIHEIVYSPDGTKLATASADFSVNLWNAQDVAKENSLLTKSNSFVFEPQTNSLSTWSNASFEILNWNLSERQKNWGEKTESTPFSIDVSKSKNLIAGGGQNGLITLFSLLNGKPLKQFQIHPKSIFAIRFSVDGNRIFVAFEDGFFQVIETETGNIIHSNQLHQAIIRSLAVSPNGKLIASGSGDKGVKILDAETFQIKFDFTNSLKPLYMVAFSADSSLLASSGADDTVRIWRMSDGKLLQELSGMSAGVFAITFSPDGKRIATASDIGIIRLWETETGQQVLAFNAGKKQITQLNFTTDGKTLVSLDNDGKASFWEAKD